MKAVNFSRFDSRMGRSWSWLHNYDCDESGRIVVGWNSCKFKVIKLFENHQLIHVNIIRVDTGKEFFVSFVYINNDPSK